MANTKNAANGTLSSVELFKENFETQFEDHKIETAIKYSTSILSSYCKRDFEEKEYISYLSGSGDYLLVIPNMPIKRIYDVSPDVYQGIKITLDNSVYSLNYLIDSKKIELSIIDFDGEEEIVKITFADNQRLSDIVDSLNAIPEITATLHTNDENEPSRKLRPVNGIIVSGQTDWLEFYKSDLQLKFIKEPDTDNVIRFNRKLSFGYENVYIRYLAGYKLYKTGIEEDSSSSSESEEEIMPDIPLDLSYLCNKLAFVLLNESEDGFKLGNITSERLGDYAYTKSSVEVSQVVKMLGDDKKLLDKYVYKELTW